MSIIWEILKGAGMPIKKRIDKKRRMSRLIKCGEVRNLYKTKEGYYFWLKDSNYLDRQIINTGIWEVSSSRIVKRFVKPGDIVLDIGANIGYYTVMMAKIVGDKGKVIAFEPTSFFGEILKMNIVENGINNCEIKEFALSDNTQQLEIGLGDDSATLHWIADESKKRGTEIIESKKLDDIIDELGLESISFIKMDIDGHEPAFFRGAIRTIKKYKPIILMEVAHANFLEAGVTAWDFYDYLKENDMKIYFEDDLSECKTKQEFLMKCGNFAYSANIIVTERGINQDI